MTYDEAVRALGFNPEDPIEGHLPLLRQAEARLKELADQAEDATQKADYEHQLEMLRQAVAVVERGPEKKSEEPKEPKPEPEKPKGSGNARMVIALVGLLLLLGMCWMGLQWINKSGGVDKLKSTDLLLEEGKAALESRKWSVAEEKYREILKRTPDSEIALEGIKQVEEGKEGERRQQVAYLWGAVQSAIESREWEQASGFLSELGKLEPEHELLVPLRERVEDGKVHDQIVVLIDEAENAIQEEQWEELETHAVALRELAPSHVDLPRYLQLSEEGKKLMAERRETAKMLYEESLALDEGVYSEEALEKMREAIRLDRKPEYQALYDKLSEYRRVLKVPGDFSSIEQALAAARPKDTIRLAAGTYEESLIIDHAISLEGAGKDETVISYPAEKSSVIEVRPNVKDVRLSGVKLMQSGFVLTSPERFPVLAVNKAEVMVEDCDVEKGSGHGIAVLEGGMVRLRNVRVSKCGWDGLAVSGEGSHAEVEGSRFDENLHHGVDSWDGGTVTMRKSRCSANVLAGVALMSEGKDFLLEQCTVDGNREVGVMVSNGAMADLISNQITVNLLGGVVARGEGTILKLQGNQVQKNKEVGVMVDKRSSLAVFDKNLISENEGKQKDLEAEIEDTLVEEDAVIPADVEPAPEG